MNIYQVKSCKLKKAYVTEDDAQAMAAHFTKKYPKQNPSRVYKCSNHWHITTCPRRRPETCQHSVLVNEWCKWCAIEKGRKAVIA